MPEQILGRTSWARPPTRYEQYCESEGVPVYRDMLGVEDVRTLQLGDWERMGGRGAFIDLDGTGGVLGLYLAEIPSMQSLEPEHHLYEEVFLVLSGSGKTEVWLDGHEGFTQTFEWQKNTVFSVPLNTWHRLVNTSPSPALVLVATNAPPMMELFGDHQFIFETPFHFARRYDPESSDYFSAADETGIDPVTGRALYEGAIIRDAVGCDLPYDGQRGPGHRRLGFKLAGNVFKGFIAEYPSGH